MGELKLTLDRSLYIVQYGVSAAKASNKVSFSDFLPAGSPARGVV